MKKKNIFIIVSCSIVITLSLLLSLFFNVRLSGNNKEVIHNDYGDEENFGDTICAISGSCNNNEYQRNSKLLEKLTYKFK